MTYPYIAWQGEVKWSEADNVGTGRVVVTGADSVFVEYAHSAAYDAMGQPIWKMIDRTSSDFAVVLSRAVLSLSALVQITKADQAPTESSSGG